MANMFKCTRPVLLRVISDILCIVIVAVPVLIIFVAVEPYHRGFFCDDESLKHPYHTDTIPIWAVGVAGIGLPIIAVLLVEALHVKKTNIFGIVSYDPNEHLKTYVGKCYKNIITFLFGAAVTQFLTEVGKNSIGRLRPHFFAVCNPDMSLINCSSGYIVDFTCSGTDAHILKEMRLSFPSGHASLSIFCMVFLMGYLQARLTTSKSNLIRPVLQLIAFSLAFYTCLSRVSDYKHHWSDVLGGAILGTVVSLVVIAYLCNFQKEHRSLRGLLKYYQDTLPLHHSINQNDIASSRSTVVISSEELTSVVSTNPKS